MSLDYLIERWPDVLSLAIEHLEITLTSMLIALLVAIPLGLVATHIRPATLPLLGLLGAIYTIPSLALLAALIPFLGLGRVPAVVALASYAQLFLVRNIVAGLRGADPAVIEVAHGLGMNEWQVFWNARLPLALPVILAGIRVALVTTISLATVTAWINAGGLGTLLFDGIVRDNPSQILAGTIAITTLAILADATMRLIERLTAVSRARRAVNPSNRLVFWRPRVGA